MRILFFILFSSLAFSQSFITELADKTVGKILFDKNMNIKTDTLDIYIRVNDKGYCYALDVYSSTQVSKKISNNKLKSLISNNLDWEFNDSIINESLYFKEYESLVDSNPNNDNENRYTYYKEHLEINDKVFLLIRKNNNYAIYIEPLETEFLTSEEDEYNKIVETETFYSLDDVDLFLKSNEVANKAIKLKKIQDEINNRENNLNNFPISSIELPYKLHLGLTKIEIEKHLTNLFGNFIVEVQDSYSYKESFQKGIYQEVLYSVKEGVSNLRIYMKFFHNKVFHIGYSHFNNFSENEELNTEVYNKLLLIKNKYDLLFDINYNGYDDDDNNSIWSIKEELKFEEENEELLNSIEEAKRKKQNSIGKKM